MKKLLLIAMSSVFLIATNVSAQQDAKFEVTDLMRVGNSFKSYEKVVDEISKKAPTKNTAESPYWAIDKLRINEVSDCYKFAALQYEIYTKGIKIDLRDFRFGPKLVNKNNEEEVMGNIFVCWLKGAVVAETFDKTEGLMVDYLSLNEKGNAKKIRELQAPVANFLKPFVDKNRQ